MDNKKIGAFLRDLRKEHNLTQEELGEKLGATNKTISRWETGTYMPPVDILLQLSKLYDVSVNEILSGERLNTSDYQPKAEENFVLTLNDTSIAKKHSRKVLIICLSIILAVAIASAVVIGLVVGKGPYITVKFNLNGGKFLTVRSEGLKIIKAEGDVYTYRLYLNAAREDYYGGYKINEPDVLFKKDNCFAGWCTDLEQNSKFWDFSVDKITDDITFYAKWEIASNGLSFERYTIDSGYDYSTKLDGYAVTGANALFYSTEDVYIPSYYNGKPVLAITDKAFEWDYYIKSVYIPNTVRIIEGEAFNSCEHLKYVRFGENVEHIRDGAFNKCSNLKTLDLPDSLKVIGTNAFSDCKKLQGVVIPDNVNYIAGNAFSDCTSLTSVTLGANLQKIDDTAFARCNNLLEVHDMSKYLNAIDKPDLFPNALGIYKNNLNTTKLFIDDNEFVFFDDGGIPQLIGYFGDDTVVTLPDDCDGKQYVLRDYAFYDNDTITEITISGGTQSTGKNTFAHSNLKKVSIKDGVKIIDEFAFGNCIYLEQVCMSDTVERIGDSAFQYCYNLIEVTFSKQLKTIGSEVFAFCNDLYKINLPGNINRISPIAFAYCRYLSVVTMEKGNGNYHVDGNCLIETNSKVLIKGFGECVIPTDGSVTCIGYDAFKHNFSLMNINIPACIVSIGNGIFNDCPLLKQITIDSANPNYKVVDNCLISIADKALIAFTPGGVIPEDGSVTSIRRGAMTYSRKSITISVPKSVTHIDERAFDGCANIRLKYDGAMEACVENTEYGKDVTKLYGVLCIECTDGELYRKWVEDSI